FPCAFTAASTSRKNGPRNATGRGQLARCTVISCSPSAARLARVNSKARSKLTSLCPRKASLNSSSGPRLVAPLAPVTRPTTSLAAAADAGVDVAAPQDESTTAAAITANDFPRAERTLSIEASRSCRAGTHLSSNVQLPSSCHPGQAVQRRELLIFGSGFRS